jgi:hypothetical protein
VRHVGIALLVLAAALPAAAGPVTGLTSFTPGMPARASEVNGNFGIVANAVNDNHTRLTAAETAITGLASKQNRVTGTCSAGNAMTAIAADGSVTCAPLAADGAVSVPNTSLVVATTGALDECRLVHTDGASFFTGNSHAVSQCVALAPLSLPHGATLTGLSCRVSDTFGLGDLTVSLYRRSLTADAVAFVYETGSSDDTGAQTIVEDDAAPEVVDNIGFSYGLLVDFDLDPPDFPADVVFGLSFTGCSITYDAP